MNMCSLPILQKRLLTWAVCCILFAAKAGAQTSVMVTYYNGTEQGYPVSTSGKLFFENGSLQIVQTNAATPVSIPVSIIRKLSFSNSALPLHMVDFTYSSEKARVVLSWKTANEVNTAHFAIERSADGLVYESIGQVASVNSSAGGNYNFIDLAPATGVSYYRLKQVDTDKKYTYSKILTVNRTTATIITVLPNPASDHIQIRSSATARLNVKIYSAAGRLVIAGSYAPGESISLSRLAPGMYTAVVNDKSYKFIKR